VRVPARLTRYQVVVIEDGYVPLAELRTEFLST
jgi:hypothetical protein